MKTARLRIEFTPVKGRKLVFNRAGTLVDLLDGALEFLLKLARRAR